MCFNKASSSFTSPHCLSAPALSPGRGRKMALRYPFVTLIGARRAVLTFGPLGSCSSLVSISSKKSSLINLSSSKMCDSLGAKPLKSVEGWGWVGGPGQEANQWWCPGEEARPDTAASSRRQCCFLYRKNLFHPSVLSGLRPGQGSLLLSLLK